MPKVKVIAQILTNPLYRYFFYSSDCTPFPPTRERNSSPESTAHSHTLYEGILQDGEVRDCYPLLSEDLQHLSHPSKVNEVCDLKHLMTANPGR